MRIRLGHGDPGTRPGLQADSWLSNGEHPAIIDLLHSGHAGESRCSNGTRPCMSLSDWQWVTVLA